MRVKGGPIRSQRRKKTLKEAKGYFGAKSVLYKKAKEQLLKSGAYAFNDRRKLKGEYRKLWILRINAAVRPYDLSYSKFMYGLKLANILLNRKMLSELAIHEPKEFAKLVEVAKAEIAKNPIGPSHDEKEISETKRLHRMRDPFKGGKANGLKREKKRPALK